MPENQKKTILAVVYDPCLGRILHRILKKDFNVEIKNTLEEARQKINETQLNTVITDWTRVNGPEVIKCAQEKGIKKIVVMNGGLIEEKEEKKLEESEIDIISKPFEKNELINLLRKKISKI